MLATAISMLLLAQTGAPAPAAASGPTTKAVVEAEVRAGFARLDANKDGFVDRAEADRAQSAAVSGAQARYRQRRSSLFARIDTNKDGTISRAEFEGAGAPRAPAPGTNPWLNNNDTDRNGRVALSEALAQSTQRFDRLDTNKDGRVTDAEVRAAQARQAPRR